MQQQDFEEVAHRFGVADDVMADRLRPEPLAHATRAVEHRQFAGCPVRVARERQAQRTAFAQQAHQQRLLFGLLQRRIVALDPRLGEQVRQGFLVPVRTLAEVEGGEVEPEHFGRPDQRSQAKVDQPAAVPVAQRGRDHPQVGREGGGVRVWLAGQQRGHARRRAGEGKQGCRQPGVDADGGLPVRLVGAVWAVVA